MVCSLHFIRADYWKSQDRKFCDFCKCWIADNKPSVQFHENGKRHKENVAKRISEISKKSAKQHKESIKLDAEMKKMEEAAMRAYMKDIESNPDYTSQQIMQQLQEKGQDLSSLNPVKAETPPPPKKREKKQDKKNVKKKVIKKKIWYESQTAEGYKYYWNNETEGVVESVWEAPEEYVSLEEQQQEAEAPFREQDERNAGSVEELRSLKAREEMKKFSTAAPIVPKSEISGPILGPTPKVDPYGKWTTVKKVVTKPIDLQLPKQKFIEIKVPAVKESKVKIKEKIVESLDCDDNEVCSGFKKRKPNPNRLNMRRRMDDDD